MGKKNKVEIEIARTRTAIDFMELETKVFTFLSNLPDTARGQLIDFNSENTQELKEYAEVISIDENFKVPLKREDLVLHCYKNYHRGPEIETFDCTDEDGEEIPTSNHWILPSKEFVGLWENLIYDDGIKENILRFAETSLVFSKLRVNSNVICCNRMILLHGPPGTGKTSLCKALAQKLSIRLSSSYKYTHLVEINSHSLFSKWFSESGKLVLKLFTKIKEIISQSNSLVCVLIDEVESIAYCRDSMSGNEPKDALRVVNAVLTQLDQIRNYPNVLILTTSNLTSTIDIAFLDRADLKQFVGYPSVKAIYRIYVSAIQELLRVGLIIDGEVLSYECLLSETNNCIENGNKYCNSMQLLQVAEQSIGLSGRTLRRIPFLAHALFIEADHISLEMFIEAMRNATENYINNQKMLAKEKH